MSTIWKAQLSAKSTEYWLPIRSEILCVQMQNGEPHMWFMCDPEIDNECRRIVIIGTGHKFDKRFIGRYLGTFQMNNGQLVFHVFESLA